MIQKAQSFLKTISAMQPEVMSYFRVFFAPFKSLKKQSESYPESGQFELSAPMALAISWPFVMVNASFTLFISIWSGNFLLKNQIKFFSNSALALIHISTVEVVLFPLMVLSYFAIGKGVIRLGEFLFLKKRLGPKLIEDVLAASLASQVWLLIPIFGNAARTVHAGVILYAGFVERLGLRGIEAIFLIFLPFFGLCFFLFSILAIVFLILRTGPLALIY